MTSLIIIATMVLCVGGVSLFIWSLFDTRKKYYNDFITRKKK